MQNSNNERSQYYELRNAWLWFNRRHVLAGGAAALANLVAVFDKAYAESQANANSAQQSSGPTSTPSNVAQADGRTPSTGQNMIEKIERPKDDTKQLEALLGARQRIPTFGTENLTTTQLRATGTPDEASNVLSSPAGAFVSVSANRKLYSSGEAPLARSSRSPASAGVNSNSPLMPGRNVPTIKVPTSAADVIALGVKAATAAEVKQLQVNAAINTAVVVGSIKPIAPLAPVAALGAYYVTGKFADEIIKAGSQGYVNFWKAEGRAFLDVLQDGEAKLQNMGYGGNNPFTGLPMQFR